MNTSIIIRPLAPTDSMDELTQLLHRAYARLGKMGLNYTAVNQTPDVTASRIRDGQCFVADVGGKVVGTIVVRPPSPSLSEYFTRCDVASVTQFGVEPTEQGTGVGRALLAYCEVWATAHGFSEVALDTAEEADHLIRFYAGVGYKVVSSVQWPGKTYRSLVLAKALSPDHSSLLGVE